MQHDLETVREAVAGEIPVGRQGACRRAASGVLKERAV